MTNQEEISIAGKYTPVEAMKPKLKEEKKVGKEEKKESSKQDKQKKLEKKVEEELNNKLTADKTGKKGENIRASILEEKQRDYEASLFYLIQNKIKEILDNPDSDPEIQKATLKGLKEARQILITEAKQIGALEGAKRALLEAQVTDNYVQAIERVSRINVGSLEHEATSLLEGSTPDFGGMNEEYVKVARYNMELALLEASGREDSSKAKELKQKIEYLGWGTPPPIDDQARDYVERSAQKLKEEEQELELDKKEPTLEEEGDRYEQERKYVEGVLEKYIKEAVELVGDNNNIEPFKTRSLDSGIYMMQDFEAHLEEDLIGELAKGEGLPEEAKKARLILERVQKLREWMEGNAVLLKAAGMVLEEFHSGMGQLEYTVKKRGRIDLRMTDLKKVFSSLSEGGLKVEGEWKFGEEIIRKQDEALAIFRAIAAAHRVKSRNGGKDIVAQHKTLEGTKVEEEVIDYKINQKQLAFIEAVFDSKEKIFKELEGKKVEDWLVTIDEIFGSTEGAIKGLKAALEIDSELKVLVGKEYELKGDVLKRIKKELRQNKAVWVDGVKWEVDANREKDSINDIITELDWRVGSGDKVFIGDEQTVDKDGYEQFVGANFIGGNKVALLKETPYEIDNPFVVYSTPHSVDKIMAKVSWMMDRKVQVDGPDGSKKEIFLWDALQDERREIDIEEEARACAKDITKDIKDGITIDLLNDHIINISRIFALYTAEAAGIGWGFDYKDEGIGGTVHEVTVDDLAKWEKLINDNKEKELAYQVLVLDGEEKKIDKQTIKKAKEIMEGKIGYEVMWKEKTKITSRGVSEGGPKAATDISTPLHWLRSEAGNKWKDWTRGMLPLSKRTSRWINHHEPGWVPDLDKYGNWKVTFLGKELYIHEVPAKLDLGLLNMAKIDDSDYDHKGKRILDLVYEGKGMSEMPYAAIDDDVFYRKGYIDWSQAAKLLKLISQPLDRDTMAEFLGVPRESVPRMLEFDELMKRVTLATRNLAENEGARAFIPLLASLGLAFQENLLKSSAEPGVFYPGSVKRKARNTEVSLLEYAPRGDTGAGVEIARRFAGYMESLTDMGRALNTNLIRARYSRRSLEDIDEEIEKKKRKNLSYSIA